MTMVKRQAILLVLMLAAAPAAAAVGATKSIFDKGSSRVSIGGGYGRAFEQDYFLLNGGFGYNVAPNFELGLDVETWLGGHPQFTKVSPGVRFIVPTEGKVKPYIGGFYRRVFYQD